MAMKAKVINGVGVHRWSDTAMLRTFSAQLVYMFLHITKQSRSKQ